LATLRDLGIRRDIAAALELLAGAAGTRGDIVRAVRLLAAADALRAALGAPRAPADQDTHARQVAAMRAQLGPAAFAAAWEAGRGMTLEQAVAGALGDAPGGAEPAP
jgi:hypothetical protein